MKTTLALVAFSASIAVTGAPANISVCVNNASGKARFATKCSSKEKQQFLSSSGGSQGSGLRTIVKKFNIPAGTSPGSGASWDSNWALNYVAKLSCDPSEFMLGTMLIGIDPNYGNEKGGYCYKENIESPPDVTSSNSSRRAYCGISTSTGLSPTKQSFSIYMISDCIKR
jgi:hypothetical protein